MSSPWLRGTAAALPAITLAAIVWAGQLPVAATGSRTPDTRPAGAAPAISQPDIVVLMVDDLGDVGPRILERLPHLSALFLNGRSFDEAYSEQPLCCPGRATFLTGQHVRHHGVTINDARLLDPTNTIATALHDAGYHTGLIGKYLNLAELLDDPSPVGWDSVALLLLGDDETYTASPTTSDWLINDEATSLGYRDRAVSDLSVQFVQDAPADEPLFMWSNPRAPHWATTFKEPWAAAIEPPYVGDARCAGIEPWKPPSYSYSKAPDGFPLDDICRSLLTVDDEVGQLETAFAARGTQPLWMLTSDNGMAWGEHSFPLKNVPWATPLPLYFAGPGIMPGHTDALVSNIDFGPTLAELGGTTMPWADGVSFARLLHQDGSFRAVMIEDQPEPGFTGGPWRKRWHAIRTPQWHLLRIGQRKALLYDLVHDPWQLHPVTNKGVKQQLKQAWPYGTF
jgi:N-acetylglucosamine-6-sulfatase